MAILSNINDKFAVDSTGAVQFSGTAGTSGQILKSNGNSAPTWVDASTVIGGPYLPLSGGTITGATSTASGISFTVGGILTTDKILVVKGQNLAHIASSVIISQENTTKSQIRFYGANTSTAGILEFVGSSSDGSAGGVRMTIDSSGNVGIGTITPSAKLDVRLPGTTGKVAELHNSVGYGIGFTLQSDGGVNTINSESNQALAFATNGASNERMRIDISGNVGIGETSPSQQLTLSNSSSSKIQIKGHSASNGLFIGMDSAVNAQLWNVENGYIRFATNDTERMRITSNGAIGIGGANYGTSGQVLTSNGSGSAPVWQTPSAGGDFKTKGVTLTTVTSSGTTVATTVNASTVTNNSCGVIKFTMGHANNIIVVSFVVYEYSNWWFVNRADEGANSNNTNDITYSGVGTNTLTFKAKNSSPSSGYNGVVMIECFPPSMFTL